MATIQTLTRSFLTFSKEEALEFVQKLRARRRENKPFKNRVRVTKSSKKPDAKNLVTNLSVNDRDELLKLLEAQL
jgi:hypothetical protein